MPERRWTPATLGTLPNPGGRSVNGLLDYEPYATTDEAAEQQYAIQREGTNSLLDMGTFHRSVKDHWEKFRRTLTG